MLRTRENSDFFSTLDEIYLVVTYCPNIEFGANGVILLNDTF